MKKLLCVLLSLIMIIPFSVMSFAETEAITDAVIEQIETDTPVIVVRGMNFAGGLQFDRGTENAKPVNVQFDAGELIKYLGKTLIAVVTSFSIEAGISVVGEYISELFYAYPCDNNGDSLYENISAEYYPGSVAQYPEVLNRDATDEISLVTSLADRYGAENVYYFVYDWRLDPMDNADILDETVNIALSDHGCEKVDIICCSMGGSIGIAYMAEYGYDKIDTIISNTSVMFGSNVTSDLFQGKVEFNADAVVRYVTAMVPDLAGLIKVAKITGTLDLLCNFMNKFAHKYVEQIYDEVLTPIFATIPGFWSMMNTDDYPVCREFVFEGKEDEYAGLLQRLDAYYDTVASRRQEILDDALENGVKLAVISSYNSPLIPAYESAKYQGDGMLETAPMAGGALTSVLGSTLPEEQLTGDAKYISPDKCINANTCMYKDYTWFTKDAGHVLGFYGSDCSYFLFTLLESEAQPDIYTWAEYPQFLQSDASENLSVLK